MVDFNRWEPGKHTVERIEYDPGRSAHIALLKRVETGKLSYIVAPQGMRAGEVVESFRQGVPQELLDSLGGSTDAGMIASKTAWRGNCLPLHMIPSGTIVYCVGLYNGKGAQLCRSAGTFGMVVNKNDEDIKKRLYVDVRLKSGEVRMIHRNACATVGIASNSNHFRRQLGKAGRSRWLGIRPTVRGVAMNANEHPHGGGRGKSKGNVISQSIWGTLVCIPISDTWAWRLTVILGKRRLQDEEEVECQSLCCYTKTARDQAKGREEESKEIERPSPRSLHPKQGMCFGIHTVYLYTAHISNLCVYLVCNRDTRKPLGVEYRAFEDQDMYSIALSS